MSPHEPGFVTMRPFRVLFVCSGNTCRSPMAEALARHLAAEEGLDGLEFRSAGTAAGSGLPASDGARRAVERHGMSLEDHRSSPLTPALVEWADLILGMGPSHLELVREMGGGGKGMILGLYAGGGEGGPEHSRDLAVPDPFGGDDPIYEATFLTLERYVRSVLERVRREESR